MCLGAPARAPEAGHRAWPARLLDRCRGRPRRWEPTSAPLALASPCARFRTASPSVNELSIPRHARSAVSRRGHARGREIPRMITESPQPSAALDHRDQYRQSRRNAQVCGNSRYAESGAISCAQRAARSATRSTRRAGRSRPRATTSGVAAASAKAPAIRLVR